MEGKGSIEEEPQGRKVTEDDQLVSDDRYAVDMIIQYINKGPHLTYVLHWDDYTNEVSTTMPPHWTL